MEKEKGIKEYNSLEELLNYLKENFEEFTTDKDYDRNKIVFYSYFKPRKRIKCNPFYMHCMYFGKKIKNV